MDQIRLFLRRRSRNPRTRIEVKYWTRYRRQIGHGRSLSWSHRDLLQYAGEGSFNSFPRVLQLGKDSVAFASDAIPGKHWVLQVSESMDADGTPTADSRSLLSRLAFRSADYRRTATSLLLILDSAEDMGSWIAAVRREIEALGGRKMSRKQENRNQMVRL